MIQLEERTHLNATVRRTPVEDRAWVRAAFFSFVALYLALLVWFGSVKVMAFDEMLSFYTERVSSLAALLAVQRNHPVSLDPPLMHLAAHGALVLGSWLGLSPVLCVRLPALAGAALMAVCLFVFVQRLAGAETAMFAVLGTLVTEQFHFVEARPYGALLGLAALALALWQNAVRGVCRGVSLVGLFLALGLATGSHYFGILLVLPFLAAECVRAVDRRRLDFGTLAALSGSLLFAVLWLPFLRGAHQYKANYYIGVKASDLAETYVSSLQAMLGLHASAATWVLFCVAMAGVGWGAWTGYRATLLQKGLATWPTREAAAVEWTAVVGFALLPLAGLGLALVASGAFESRYVTEFTLGAATCLAAGLVHAVRWPRLRGLLLAAGCVLALGAVLWKVKVDRTQQRALQALAQRMAGSGGGTRILMTDKEEFVWLQVYAAGSPAQTRAVWVADLRREIAATGSDNIDRTMLNLRLIAGLPAVSYDQVRHTPDALRMVVNSTTQPVNWLPSALLADGWQFPLVETVSTDRVYQLIPPK